MTEAPMALHPLPAQRFSSEHAHVATERCPLCNQVLPHDLSAEQLETRLQAREREAAGAVEKHLRAQFELDQATKIDAVKKQAAADAAEREKGIRAEAKALAERALQAEVAKATEDKANAIKDKDSAVEAVNKLKAEREERTN